MALAYQRRRWRWRIDKGKDGCGAGVPKEVAEIENETYPAVISA